MEWQRVEKDGRELFAFKVGGNQRWLQVSVYPNEREEWGFDAGIDEPIPVVFWRASSTKVSTQEAAQRWYEDAIVWLVSALA